MKAKDISGQAPGGKNNTCRSTSFGYSVCGADISSVCMQFQVQFWQCF